VLTAVSTKDYIPSEVPAAGPDRERDLGEAVLTAVSTKD
jgi:hypothetical protein